MFGDAELDDDDLYSMEHEIQAGESDPNTGRIHSTLMTWTLRGCPRGSWGNTYIFSISHLTLVQIHAGKRVQGTLVHAGKRDKYKHPPI